jgi:hypothetical protein
VGVNVNENDEKATELRQVLGGKTTQDQPGVELLLWG